ncbi:MAG: class I SAM-dependent methyltransferase [Promethearchaeota archaeon]
MSRSKKLIPPRIPEGEAIEDEEDLPIEQINEEFKRRMKEYKNFVKFIMEDLKLKDHSKVLEIGPGPAWISIILVKENPTISLTGLEISEDMIRIANQNVIDEKVEENITFVQGNAKNMSRFKDNSYDAVITHDSLHHWEEPISIFNEIARVLKPNGILCIGDGRRDLGIGAKIIFRIVKQFIPKRMSYYWKTSIMAGYTPTEARNMLDQTKLSGNFEIKADLFDIIIHNN